MRRRRVRPGRRLSILAFALLCIPAAENHARQPIAQAPPGEALPETAAPSADVAIAAFTLVESWLRSGEMPDTIEGLPEFSGVCIALRVDGVQVARTCIAPGPNALAAPGAAADAITPHILVRAARDLRAQLLNTRREQSTGAAADRAFVQAIMGTLAMTMELAGPLVPFTAQTYDDVDMSVSPGLEGIGTLAGKSWDSIFPLQMLGASMTPGAALRSTIARATGDAALPLPGTERGSPGAIARSHAARYYKFRTSQVTQRAPRAQPITLHRGGVVFPKSRLTRAEIASAAESMADHLQRRLGALEEPLGIDATAKSELRAARSQALLALVALQRFNAAAPNQARSRWLQHATDRVLAQVQPRDLQGPGLEPIDAALIAIYLTDTGAPLPPDASKVLGSALACAFDLQRDAFDASIPPAARGLIALALVRLRSVNGSGVEPDAALKAVRCAFRAGDAAALSHQMPWLAWAEIEAAGPGAEIPAAQALIDVRDLALSRVIRAEDAGDDEADMVGGLVGATGGSVLPTWHTARPMCFVASTLADSRLTTKAQRPALLGQTLGSVRFIRQLMIDGESAVLAGDRAVLARGGVCAAPWDFRQPADATSFGLLFLTQTLRTIDRP